MTYVISTVQMMFTLSIQVGTHLLETCKPLGLKEIFHWITENSSLGDIRHTVSHGVFHHAKQQTKGLSLHDQKQGS